MIKYNHFNLRSTFESHIKTKSGSSDLATAVASTSNDCYYAINFIKDTQEIYTHGRFYDCSTFDDTAIRSLISGLDSRVTVLEALPLELEALIEEVAENELVMAQALTDINNNKVDRTELPDFDTFATQDELNVVATSIPTSLPANGGTSDKTKYLIPSSQWGTSALYPRHRPVEHPSVVDTRHSLYDNC